MEVVAFILIETWLFQLFLIIIAALISSIEKIYLIKTKREFFKWLIPGYSIYLMLTGFIKYFNKLK
jgi:hypothetical protein